MGVVVLFVLLVVSLAVFSFLGLRKFEALESEKGRRPIATPVEESPGHHPESEVKPPATELGLEERILEQVGKTPGILQADLYALLPDQERRIVQTTLRGMDKSGAMVRKKEKGTYQLFLK